MSDRFIRSRYHSYSSMRSRRGLPHVTLAQYRRLKQARAGRDGADLRHKDHPPRIVTAEDGPRELVRQTIAECHLRPWSYACWACERLARNPDAMDAAVRAAWESVIEMEGK